MKRSPARRKFLARSALGAAALAAFPRLSLGDARATPASPLISAFDLADVRLGEGPAKDAMLVNLRHLMAQSPDRLLHTFRLTAGLPTSAEPLGGWEAPDNELRGH
jgi:hypothetical protein